MKRLKRPYCYEFPRPAVTVDTVVLTRADRPRVLLIRRKHEPFAGSWALPGGFVDANETLDAAARRELQEETGLPIGALEPLQAFGDPGRDPRGWTISVVFLARVDGELAVQAGDDAADAAWHSLARPPKMAFDHGRILACVRERLRWTKVKRSAT